MHEADNNNTMYNNKLRQKRLVHIGHAIGRKEREREKGGECKNVLESC